jgi:hypothetical protein
MDKWTTCRLQFRVHHTLPFLFFSVAVDAIVLIDHSQRITNCSGGASTGKHLV